MFELSAAEAVGYAASALVVASLAMTSVVRLRALSLVGAITFVAYGVLIDSVPVLVTNAAIAALNVWFLRAELGMKRELGASPIRADEPFLVDFLEFHLDDIRRFQPDFELPEPDAFTLLLTRDGLPAGALVGSQHGDRLDVSLDYVLRPFRDSRLGDWLYGPGCDVLRDRGIRTVVAEPGGEDHRGYLARLGFGPEGDRYVLRLPRQSRGRIMGRRRR